MALARSEGLLCLLLIAFSCCSCSCFLLGAGPGAAGPKAGGRLGAWRPPSGRLGAGCLSRVSTTARRGRSSICRQYRGGGGEQNQRDEYLQKQQFDLLSLRQFRREALVNYANANQSEPIRILLCLFFTALGACSPLLADALGAELDTTGLVAGAVTTVFSGGLFWRERSSRTRRLARMDREAELSELSVTYEDPMSGGRRTFRLRDLRGKRSFVALYAPSAALAEAVREAAVYRRRLGLAQVSVIGVATEDGNLAEEWEEEGGRAAREGWLWKPSNSKLFREYFAKLLSENAGLEGGGSAWLAVNTRGKSCGSGRGVPTWDSLLGTVFPPLDIVPSADDKFSDEEQAVVTALEAFYAALTTGDVDGMKALWSTNTRGDSGVSELVDAGGRLDKWEDQLKEGSRPQGLQVSSRDVRLVAGGKEAWSTCIEANAGSINTLLATQHWIQEEGGEWKLLEHRTIPWSLGLTAAATLRCDCRGCVAGLRNMR